MAPSGPSTPRIPGGSNSDLIVLRDFTPGIRQRTGVIGGITSSSPQTDVGVARADGTYRCIALPGGGLGPLPRRDFSQPLTPQHTALSEGGTAYIHATGWGVLGPIFSSSAGAWPSSGSNPGGLIRDYAYLPIDARDTTNHRIDFHIGLEYFRSSNSRRFFEWHRRRVDGPSGTAASVRLHTVESTRDRDDSSPRPSYFVRSRFNTQDRTQSGAPCMVCAWRSGDYHRGAEGSTTDALATQSFYRVFPSTRGAGYPDIASDVTDTLLGAPPPATTSAGPIIAHQGRIICMERFIYPMGTGNVGMQVNEELEWTEVNGAQLDSSRIVYSYDNPSGYGAWASLVTGDLLLISHDEGGLLIQGDVDDPTNRRLPGIVGTGGTECVAANTSIGTVYGVNRGSVYAWSGGALSNNIAPFLEDDFWVTNEAFMFGFKGGFKQWGHYILAPNNWLFDPVLESWWRIEEPTSSTTYYHYTTNPVNGYLYALRPRFQSGEDTFVGFNRALGAASYKWTSQPLRQTLDRQVSAREVVVMVQGAGTVKVKIMSPNVASTSRSEHTFTLPAAAATTPYVDRAPISHIDSNLSIELTATNTAINGPAPIIYEVAIVTSERTRVGNDRA